MCKGQELRKAKAVASSEGNILSLLPAAPNLILPAGIFRQNSGAQARLHELWESYQCSGSRDGEGSAFPWQQQRTHGPLELWL